MPSAEGGETGERHGEGRRGEQQGGQTGGGSAAFALCYIYIYGFFTLICQTGLNPPLIDKGKILAGIVYKTQKLRWGELPFIAGLNSLAQKWAEKLRCFARAPAELVYTPFDMHLADPRLAHEFYHGRFPLAGRVVQAGSVSPFLLAPPSPEWEAALQDFSWLNHMAAAETELADAHARALTRDWIETEGRRLRGPAWQPPVAARRLLAWLCHGDILFAKAAPAFQKQLLKSIGAHMRYLRAAYAGEKDDAERLGIACALAMAALAAPLSAAKNRRAKAAARAGRRLEAELKRQILPDGGHISRNPAVLLELLTRLIPLQYAYQHCGATPPPLLIVAIDRMLPALRFFRHRDGSLANFNGVGPMLAQRLDIVLDADETAAAPLSYAPHSGYQRLAGGGTVVIADTGHSFSRALTKTANAGCLSFEMSSGLQRFIINCGIDPYGPPEYRFFGRLTAAHSTAVIEDTSSCSFADSDNPQSCFAAVMPNVEVARIEEEDIEGFIAAHDGYRNNFNLMHERAITLSRNGNVLQGSDRFYAAGAKKPLFGKEPAAAGAQIAIRFHIHPDVRIICEGSEVNAQTGEERDIFRLCGADGETWLFAADVPAHLEDSIYFSGLSGPAKTQQLVLSFSADAREGAQWSLRRQQRREWGEAD